MLHQERRRYPLLDNKYHPFLRADADCGGAKLQHTDKVNDLQRAHSPNKVPTLIASSAYSTWNSRPSGLKVFTPLSYSLRVRNMLL